MIVLGVVALKIRLVLLLLSVVHGIVVVYIKSESGRLMGVPINFSDIYPLPGVVVIEIHKQS